MTLRYTAEPLTLALRDPFVIARQDLPASSATTVVVEVRDDRHPGLVGVGEGFPEPYYGETVETILAVLPALAAAIDTVELSPIGVARASRAMDAAIRHNGAAKCALDIALHDLAAQIADRPLVEFLGLDRSGPATDLSLGIDAPETVGARAANAVRFPSLKVKVGGGQDLAILEAVRARYDGPIRVDANTGWDLDAAIALLPQLGRLGVELIEQPFPPHRRAWLAELQSRTDIPIVADESAVTIDDLDDLVGVVDGVNVKLAKCGGVGPARAMLERARALGFRTLLGCMQETSIGIGASAALASLADWVDLDGSLLLADDPFEGPVLGPDCRWQLPDVPGHGVRRRAHGEGSKARAIPTATRARGLVWAGVRTTRVEEMRSFVADVLSIPLVHADESLAIYQLPDTSLFEVLGPEWDDPAGYPSGPVLGFWVDDVTAAAQALRDAGVPLVGPTLAEDGHRWQHFRAPDGNLYQVASGPYR